MRVPHPSHEVKGWVASPLTLRDFGQIAVQIALDPPLMQ